MLMLWPVVIMEVVSKWVKNKCINWKYVKYSFIIFIWYVERIIFADLWGMWVVPGKKNGSENLPYDETLKKFRKTPENIKITSTDTG